MIKKKSTVLITGATAGIGEATARLFAKEWQAPLTLILVARRDDRLQKLREELSSDSVTVETVVLDIGDRAAVEKFAASALAKNVDILVNNAGLAMGRGPIQTGQLDDWDAMIDTNLKGLLYITHSVLPHMVKRKSGHIVNLSSIAGHTVYPNGNVYCATKFGVEALSEALRIDTLGSNVRVTNLSPGKVESEFSVVRYKGDVAQANAEYAGYQALHPVDVADAALWAISRPAHVNIQDITILPTAQASARDLHRG